MQTERPTRGTRHDGAKANPLIARDPLMCPVESDAKTSAPCADLSNAMRDVNSSLMGAVVVRAPQPHVNEATHSRTLTNKLTGCMKHVGVCRNIGSREAARPPPGASSATSSEVHGEELHDGKQTQYS